MSRRAASDENFPCLPALHTFLSTARSSCSAGSGAHGALQTLLGRCEQCMFSPGPPSWNPERDWRGWELSSMAHLSHPQILFHLASLNLC